MKILIAEDDLTSRNVLAGILKKSGYEVVTTFNGAEAWKVLQQPDSPGLAILDWMMPEIVGPEIVRRVRALQTDRPPYIIMLTIKGDKSDIVAALEAGANDYLAKPFDTGELLARVEVGRRMVEMQDARLESEARLSRAQEIAHLGSWELFLPANRLIWSDEVYRIFGLKPQEFAATYEAFLDAVHPEDRATLDVAYSNSLKEGKDNYEIVHRIVRRNTGEIRYVHERCEHFKDASGKIVRSIGMVHDITERRQMEEVQIFLAQTSSGTMEEPFFRALAKYLAHGLRMDFVCIDRLEGDGLTARTVAVWCDGKFEDNVSYALKDTPCGDVVGKSVCCFPANVCQFFPRDQVLKDLRAESYVGVTLFDHTGKPIGLIAVIGRTPLANRPLAEEILKIVAVRAANELERLDAEMALRDSEEQQTIILDSSPAMIFYKDKENRFIRVNEVLAKASGLSKKEMEGKTLWELYPQEMAERYWQDDKEVMATGKPSLNIIEEMKTSQGTGWAQTDKIPYRNSKGEILGVIGFALDITERKQMEAEKAKLEELNRQLQKAESLGRMSGAVAHHFNNQLHIVMGYLEMVIGELPPGDSRTVKLTTAMRAARKASEVSGLLLDYLGQIPCKFEPLDLAELCNTSLSILQTGKPQNVEIETDLPSPGPYISADAKRIQQLLTNLIINAWEAIGDKAGTIRLSVTTVSKAEIPSTLRFPLEWRSKEQPYVCLEVTDTGCGIQEENMDKLFDPFYSTKFTGRGLGLSVALGIVKAHGAAITVENRISGGSTFSVFFPLSDKPDKSDKSDKSDKPPKIVNSGTILLAEDEDAVRKMTATALATFGFTVLQAKDGVEAVEIFKQHKNEISCLFCDLTMPRMGGWETISALRAIRKNLPVILASGYDETSVMAGEHSEYPDFFLNKPYDLHKIGDAIGHAMACKE